MHHARILQGNGAYDNSVEPLRGAIDVAERAGATGPQLAAMAELALATVTTGDLEGGLDLVARAHALVPRLQASRDNQYPIVTMATFESDICLKAGLLDQCEHAAMRGIATAQRIGEANSSGTAILVSNAVEALLERGDVDEARRLMGMYDVSFEPTTSWVLHICQLEIEFRDGLTAEAQHRMAHLQAGSWTDVSREREMAMDMAVLAIWAGRPQDVLPDIASCVARAEGTGEEIFWGGLLVLGARAAADLAQTARARRDAAGLAGALDVLTQVEAIADRMGNRPFTDHPYVVRIPADRAAWHAERARAHGRNDLDEWTVCAELWEGLGRPHRAAYAWWRCAEAALMAGAGAVGAATTLRRAAELAVGMVPLQDAIAGLATRARITLEAPGSSRRRDTTPSDGELPAAGGGVLPSARSADPYGLTHRELAVLRLVAAGRTNAQISAELFISPKTASVHVTNILRKLEVDNRTQAAAVAERAGLLAATPPAGQVTGRRS